MSEQAKKPQLVSYLLLLSRDDIVKQFIPVIYDYDRIAKRWRNISNPLDCDENSKPQWKIFALFLILKQIRNLNDNLKQAYLQGSSQTPASVLGEAIKQPRRVWLSNLFRWNNNKVDLGQESLARNLIKFHLLANENNGYFRPDENNPIPRLGIVYEDLFDLNEYLSQFDDDHYRLRGLDRPSLINAALNLIALLKNEFEGWEQDASNSLEGKLTSELEGFSKGLDAESEDNIKTTGEEHPAKSLDRLQQTAGEQIPDGQSNNENDQCNNTIAYNQIDNFSQQSNQPNSDDNQGKEVKFDDAVTESNRANRFDSPITVLIERFLPARSIRRDDPKKYSTIVNYLGRLEKDLLEKIDSNCSIQDYYPLKAKSAPSGTYIPTGERDPALLPIQQKFKQIIGLQGGGDSADVSTAQFNRRSKTIDDILKFVRKSTKPTVLLGEPGSGKSITLKRVAYEFAKSEKNKVRPRICLFIRLGDFFTDGDPSIESVEKLVLRAAAKKGIEHLISDLIDERRLLLIFDGMDEMSRLRYNDHTRALSNYATHYEDRVRTLFSCRITDFSTEFRHNRVIILPLDDDQVLEFIGRQINNRIVEINGQVWTAARLAERLLHPDSGFDASNPFNLWLFLFFVSEQKRWPKNRIELLGHYIRLAYDRRLGSLSSEEDYTINIRAWAKLAYEITTRNKGATIRHQDALLYCSEEEIDRGTLCGVLVRTKSDGSTVFGSYEGPSDFIRFEHHRFQEYLTALHIKNESIELGWSSLFAIPRWQETLVNLMMMGESNQVLDQLQSEIDRCIANHEYLLENPSEKAHRDLILEWYKNQGAILKEHPYLLLPSYMSSLKTSLEYEFMDLVGLCGRLLGHAPSVDVEFENIRKTFIEAVYILAFHGDPISQITALKALTRLPDADAYPMARRSLAKDTIWLKYQAVELLSTQQIGQGKSADAFENEVEQSIEDNQLVKHYRKLKKVANSLKNRKHLATLRLSCLYLGSLYIVGLVALLSSLIFVSSGFFDILDIRRASNAEKLTHLREMEDYSVHELIYEYCKENKDNVFVDLPEGATLIQALDMVHDKYHDEFDAWIKLKESSKSYLLGENKSSTIIQGLLSFITNFQFATIVVIAYSIAYWARKKDPLEVAFLVCLISGLIYAILGSYFKYEWFNDIEFIHILSMLMLFGFLAFIVCLLTRFLVNLVFCLTLAAPPGSFNPVRNRMKKWLHQIFPFVKAIQAIREFRAKPLKHLKGGALKLSAMVLMLSVFGLIGSTVEEANIDLSGFLVSVPWGIVATYGCILILMAIAIIYCGVMIKSVLIKTIGIFGLVIGTLAAIPYLVKFVFGILATIFISIGDVSSATMVWITVSVIAVTSLIALATALVILKRKIQGYFICNIYEPIADSNSLKEIINNSPPSLQAAYLISSSSESLGISRREYVEFLRAIARSVKKDPALSRLWERISEYEGRIRHED